MPATNCPCPRALARVNACQARQSRQAGATIVEFALLMGMFFLVMFSIIEIARVMFIFNAVYDGTRRAASAASVTDPADTAALAQIRQGAVYRTSAGTLALSPEIRDDAIRIDYLWMEKGTDGNFTLKPISSGSSWNANQNRKQCVIDPYSADCARFVRVRLCDPAVASSCDPVQFKTLTTLLPFTLPINFSTTITPLQSSGFTSN
ncbi:MAG: TadE/TadG family type IV pilus assembly protein [Massilia sp.]